MKLLTALLVVVFVSSCSTPPAQKKLDAPTTPNLNKTTCSQQNDQRVLEIKSASADKFELYYTKFGSEKSIAKGSKVYCQQVNDQIKSHLIRSGFSCE